MQDVFFLNAPGCFYDSYTHRLRLLRQISITKDHVPFFLCGLDPLLTLKHNGKLISSELLRCKAVSYIAAGSDAIITGTLHIQSNNAFLREVHEEEIISAV